MIEVRRQGTRWRWLAYGGAPNVWSGQTYDSPDHALRDAWTWVGTDVPALVYT